MRRDSMQQLAHRLERLGTETAFSVAQAAAAWQAKGHRVYPFHLGDINIPTAPHIVDAMNRAIADGYTGYCPGPGIPQLREALADDLGSARGIELSPDNVVVMTGGKPVITKFLQAVMNPGQEVLYPNPGFPIYESQVEYLGGTAVPYRYLPTNEGFAIDLDQDRHEPRPGGALPEPRLPDLRVAGRVPRRHGGALPLPAHERGLRDRPRSAARLDHAEHGRDHLQRPAEPHLRRVDGGRAPGDRAARPGARPLGALRRGLLRDALRGRLELDHVATRHARAHGPPVHVQQEVRDDRLAPWLRRRPGRDREGAQHAQHQRRVVHDALRAVGRRRGAPRHPGPCATDARGPAPAPRHRMRDCELHPRHERCRAPLDVLPVPRRHRGDGPHGLHRGRRLRRRGAAPDGRLVLHPRALRPPPAGRGAPVHPTRLLGHPGRRHPRGPGPSERVDQRRMSRIVVTTPVPDAAIDKLRLEHEVDAWPCPESISREELLRRVAGADAILSLLTERVDGELLDAAGPQLKVVANVAVGYDNIDVAACRERGGVATNTPGVLTEATADIAFGLPSWRLADSARANASSAPARRGSGACSSSSAAACRARPWAS